MLGRWWGHKIEPPPLHGQPHTQEQHRQAYDHDRMHLSRIDLAHTISERRAGTTGSGSDEPGPGFTTEQVNPFGRNVVDRRPVVFGDAAHGSDCPNNSGAGVDFHEGTVGDVNGRSPCTDDGR